MLLLRISRKKTCELKEISRKFLSLSKNHSSKKNEKDFLKFSSAHARLVGCNLYRFCSSYSIESNDISRPPVDTNFKSISSNTSNSFYIEHPDVTNRSENEIKDYRKDKNITVKGKNVPRPITHFSELCLPEIVKTVLSEEDYSEPTPIQSQGWPVALSCRDMVGISQTGSGKTLAYMLPAVIHAVNVNQRSARERNVQTPSPKVLVLGPTRELVQQILQASKKYIQACHLRGACAYGGASRELQLHNLRRAEICVATPGRLLDYLDNGQVNLKNCTYLVLDEADRMLDMGFEPQIRDIIDKIPCSRQTLMWSATWPREIRSLAEDFLTDYIHITVGDTELKANPNIKQNIYVMEEEEKFDRLMSLLESILTDKPSKVLVFAETKKKVDYLTRSLNRQKLEAWGIHGNCTQNQRDRILSDFRMTTPSVLIATDIASRGLDISDIHHVVNYDLPTNIEAYVHRIGRTARGSACGQSHSFFTPENSNILSDLISVLKKANQTVNPELYSLVESDRSHNSNKSYKPQRRYAYHGSYNRSYERKRMYKHM